MHGAGATGAIEVRHMASGFGVGEAVKELELRNRVRRAGWMDKRKYLQLEWPPENSPRQHPFVGLHRRAEDWTPWHASTEDLLAKDWELC